MDIPTGQARAERLLRELARLHDVLHVLFRPRPTGMENEPGSALEVLSSRQGLALYLIQSRQLSMTELATQLRLSPAAATPVADRLVELGMARRVRDAADRRLVYLATTKRGTELIRDGNVWEKSGLTVLAAVLENEVPGLEEQCAEGLVRMVEAAVDGLAEASRSGGAPPGQPSGLRDGSA
ncbi:MAG TPA: MarR family transcriptional regulator [Candidatus Dormibacteraeota bacterium]|nr:MarR family transcriptional regulator [Candidatus Dormibacteraeota bacterium]